jgi:hypothetical protein
MGGKARGEDPDATDEQAQLGDDLGPSATRNAIA